MQNSIFLVNEEPYCLWDPELAARNQEFLKGLDADFFDYSTKVHLEAEDEQRASVTLRLALHHALETLFSLLGAYVQAPDCAYAWLSKCLTPELRSLTLRISKGEPGIFTKLSIAPVNWDTVAQSVFHTYMPGTDRQTETVARFAMMWKRFAGELNDPIHIDEYNALKHGFRVQRGGFAISVGKEPFVGVYPPDSEMQLLGKSDYGSSFFTVEPLTTAMKTRSLRVSRTSVNWSIERLILLCQHAHLSINNVVTALRVINGWPASECKFLRPEASEDFDKPWKYSPGVTSMKWGHVADESNATALMKDEILAKLALCKES
jgi:hypothetical protein